MTLLCFDGNSLTDRSYELYEVGLFSGLKRLAQPWKYYLHQTMGRPLIVKTNVWARLNEREDE